MRVESDEDSRSGSDASTDTEGIPDVQRRSGKVVLRELLLVRSPSTSRQSNPLTREELTLPVPKRRVRRWRCTERA